MRRMPNSSSNPLLDLLISLYYLFQNTSFDSVLDLVLNAPRYYATWWIALYRDAPLHVLVETALVVFILWLTLIRTTVNTEISRKRSKLSKQEEEWLLDTWQPEPLVPAPSSTSVKSEINASRLF